LKTSLIFVNGWGFENSIFYNLAKHLVFADKIYYLNSTRDFDKAFDSEEFSFLRNNNKKIIITWSLGSILYMKNMNSFNNVIGVIFISGSMCFLKNDNNNIGWDKRILNRMTSKLLTNPDVVMNDFSKNITFNDKKVFADEVRKNILCINEISDQILIKSLQVMAYDNVIKFAENIKFPVLIIHGNEDSIIPVQSSYKINEIIINSKLKVIGGCKHAPFITNKYKVIKWINDFIKELDN